MAQLDPGSSTEHLAETGPLPLDGGPPPPPPRRVSLAPALLVGGLAVVIIVGFTLMGLLGSSSSPSPSAKAQHGSVRGTGLTAMPAKTALHPILPAGTVPSDIVNSITIPTTARVTSSQPSSETSTQYDATVDFVVPRASQGDVIAFYKEELHRLGWSIQSVGTVLNTDKIQVVGQKAGSDGWYWETGIVASPTTFTGGGSTGAGTSPGTASTAKDDDSTPFSLELLQEPDGG